MNYGKMLKIASVQLARDMDEFAQQYGLTGTQMTILNYLSDNDGENISQKNLTDEFAVKSSTMSVIIDRMEKRGIIRRVAVGRNKFIRSTPSAKKYVKVIQEYFKNDNERLVGQFNETEKEVIKRFLEQIGEKNA